jgi:hypothetical protein
MNRAIVTLVVGLTLICCSSIRVGESVSDAPIVHARLQSAGNAADTTYVREMTAFMRIVDPAFWREHLRSTADVAVFRSEIEEFFALRDFETRPDTPDRNEWREEMERRVSYCRAELLSSIDAPMRDVRWELMLQLGIPTFIRRVCDSSILDRYVLYWDEVGLHLACQSLNGGGVPVRIIPWDDEEYGSGALDPLVDCVGGRCGPRTGAAANRQASRSIAFRKTLADALGRPSRFVPFPGLEQIIKTNIAPLIFPNEDGTSDLWVATLTRGDQFSDSTVQANHFEIELSVYDQFRKIAGRDSVTVYGLSQVATVTDKEEIAIPGYVGCPRLQPGLYEYIVSLRGSDDANLGVYRDTITIPTRRSLRGASDVLIAFTPGTAKGPGIARHGMQIHANPSGSHARTDSLCLYVEFPEDDIPGEEYRVTVSLIPQKNVLFNWRPHTDREKTLFSSVFSRTALQGTFRGNVSLESAGSGHYFLSVQIASQLDDPSGESPVMSWTEIEVK